MPWKSFPALNPKNPNRDNGPQHGQAGYRPTRRVNRTIRFRSVDHIVVPVSHNSLLEITSGSWVSTSGPRFKPIIPALADGSICAVRQTVHFAGKGVPAVRTSLSALTRT